MFAKLKLKILQKKLDKNLKSRDRSQLHSQVKTMAFIFDEDDFKDIETLLEITSSFGVEQDHVRFLAFQKYKKGLDLKLYQVHHKQVKWNGTIDNKEAKMFLEQPFDVLIGFYNGMHPYMDFLNSASKARFKVGLENSDLRLFDLQMEIKITDIKAIIAELNKYLHVLGKVD